MSLSISVESPLQDDVRALIAALNDHLRPLSPPEFQFQMTVDEMADDDTTVFMARAAGGRALGCGALRVHSDALGEVKRMYTYPQARGAGVGSAILDAVIAQARALDLDWLMLETGVGRGFAGAWALYRRKGFTPRGPFLDYPASTWSAYFERRVESPVRARLTK